ncbi:hypothetical protein M885DRAFT_578121 [Pelagophyceae sp. CCMP2097]|nr:hypothetical protein M885DRAFT_578121 [Pelagophyceae sp. CCMP2097]
MDASLSLEWTFGVGPDVLSLQAGAEACVFYSAAHTGVIYSPASKTQKLLQGHTSAITAAAVSADKAWLITADDGPDALMVVWDVARAKPFRTLPQLRGVVAIDVSGDLVVSLSSVFDAPGPVQEVTVLDWKSCEGRPISAVFDAALVQTTIRFKEDDFRELVSTGPMRVVFWRVAATLSCSVPHVSKRNCRQALCPYTSSTFLGSKQAVSATEDGHVVLWSAEGAFNKVGLKVLHLCQSAIRHVSSVAGHLIVAGDDGCVRVYDYDFRLALWFEDVDAGPVSQSNVLQRE